MNQENGTRIKTARHVTDKDNHIHSFFVKSKILAMLLPISFLIILVPVSYAEETKTIFVGPQLVDCVGVTLQKCMMIKESSDSEWTYFYDKIRGFDFEPGYEYKLQVAVTEVENPPADASSLNYELVSVISKIQTPAIEKINRHIPYQDLCAPGFVSLGQICVLNDRCGPGAYPGKVCMIDGKTQPYLRPLQQGNVGIAATDVICAEPLQLVFKQDITPACVKSESVSKLENRGWSTTPPVIACTLQYAPVCGVNEKTYGNMCMLNADHVAIKHQGECKAEIIPTESELAREYDTIQENISSISKDIYNGMYNGDSSLDEAISILEDSKNNLDKLLQQYDSIPDDQKIDRQIGMKFMTLGKMGFASIDSQIKILKNQIGTPASGIFPDTLSYTMQAPLIDSDKGYHVTEIADGVYWLIGSGYQTIFLTTGQGVIVIDAPKPIGEKYLDAIKEVTDEPITHMIYSHHHQDHTGAAGEIFPADIEYISHKQTADILAQENDPNRPIPTLAFDQDMYAMSIGNHTIELYFIGNYHSNGDLIIIIPDDKIAMAVDLLRPGITPYRAFAVTPDMDQYLQTHDMLINDFDFDVFVSGHTGILATKDHIKQNKQFALDVMDNVKEAITLVGSDNAVEKCVELTTEQWTGKLSNLDEFMTEHCQAMRDYVMTQ